MGDPKKRHMKLKSGDDEPPSVVEGGKAYVPSDIEGSIEDEPWYPRVEIKSWEDAGQFLGCPWDFDGCSSVTDVLERIWRAPLTEGLEIAVGAIQTRVAKARVARCSLNSPPEFHWAVLYKLNSGAEIFGGAPFDHEMSLKFPSGAAEGLRRRKGAPAPIAQHTQDLELPLPCLAPFFRIHDGFGCLMATKHLPLLLANPTDSIQGSCFYVYPVRSLEPIPRRPRCVKFARVDQKCVACADVQLVHPHVIFAERDGNMEDDDESPLDFVADTVSNLAGHRVVLHQMGQHLLSS